jgi:uncharacterized membrane protein YccC
MWHVKLEKNRIIHSVKTALACLIGFSIVKSVNLPAGQWLVITILVVMCAQINVGSMLQKSYMRFLGTLAGSIIASLALMFLGTNAVIDTVVVTFSAILFSYIATGQTTISEAGTLGAVTTAVILSVPHPTLIVAAERFSEISGGILIATLVSQFVLPIHARKLLRRTQAKTLRQLRQYYLVSILDEQNKDYYELDLDVTKSLITQRKLAIEASREPFAKKSAVVTQFNKLLRCEREILRAITFMHHAYKSSPRSKMLFSTQHIIHEFHDKICNALERIAEQIGKRSKKKLNLDIPSFQLIKDMIASEKQKLNDDDLVYTNAYLFFAEIIVESLKELSQLVQE